MPNSEVQRRAISFSKRSITGGTLSNNTRDFIAEQFYFHGYFEWRNIVLIKRMLEIKEGSIIEVGANIGTETISYANLNKDNVYAFEPDPVNFECLEVIKKKNNLNNLFVYKTLVAEKSGFAYFEPSPPENSGVGFMSNNKKASTYKTRIVKLDEQLIGIKACSSIIIDVEGFELNVLKGGSGIINKFRPFVILEVNPELIHKRSGYAVNDVFSFIQENNYQCYLIDKYSLKRIDLASFEKGSLVNWACIPNELDKYSASLSRKLFMNGINPLMQYKIF
ncbi:FkbM family methyltransferase [Gramella jeungdoensis]|nr:FkbM family methyltransferase [Gramella jeungdoensis]